MKNKLIFVISIFVMSIFLFSIVAIAAEIKDKEDLERIDFIHYKKAKIEGKSAKSDPCYKLMGVKWNLLPVNYVINPANPQGLTESFVLSAIGTAAQTWDASTSKNLFAVPTLNYSAQYGVQNYQNAIVFGNYPQANVIGVTSIWMNKRTKSIVEFDMELDTDFAWGDATINPTLMDLQNIAAHELGHAVGLNDIYSGSCTSVTMYGYSTEGEVSKRTLELPDITGLRAIYGP